MSVVDLTAALAERSATLLRRGGLVALGAALTAAAVLVGPLMLVGVLSAPPCSSRSFRPPCMAC